MLCINFLVAKAAFYSKSYGVRIVLDFLIDSGTSSCVSKGGRGYISSPSLEPRHRSQHLVGAYGNGSLLVSR